MRTLYNALFIVFFALSSPYYFWRMWRRGNWTKGFGERFGQYDTKLKQALTNRHSLWLHAVSVGEVNLCARLIQALEPRIPNVKIVVSTTTTTGMAELKKKLPTHVGKIYYPVDRRQYVARAQSLIGPEAIILIEAEIWPNFIWRAQQHRIPLFLVNARVSERSRRGYQRLGFLFRPLFAAFTGVGAQSEADAARLRELGCRPGAVQVVGSLKFDAATMEGPRTLDVPGMLMQLGVPVNAPILVCGSTHAGEEVVLAEMFLRLRRQFPELFLIIVPRHFERSREVAHALEARGLKLALRSEVNGRAKYPPGELNCLLVNSTGELRCFYEVATVVFVGKSLTAQGGQNPIEPCALGKAVVFGPNMENFADVVEILRAHGGIRQVKDAVDLERALAELLSDTAQREELGQNALKAVRANLGAVERTVEMVIQGIKDRGVYLAPHPKPQAADPARP